MKEALVEETLRKFLINESITIKDAMRKMDKVGHKVLFIVDDQNKLLGSLTDGDIRRWVLSEGQLTAEVKQIYNKKPISVYENYHKQQVKKLMMEYNIEWIPVINNEGEIQKVLLWKEVFSEEELSPKRKINVPIVIMAGGKGTRLDPFTRILPKPLIPVGEKAIIEIIMDKFAQYGVSEFYVSINHKSKMIKAYFDEVHTDYRLHYFEEEKPMGTAGSLKYLEGKLNEDILVSNCDIIIESDYYELVNFHKTKNYDLTIVGSFRHFQIPYGICTIEDGGQLAKIDEKPEYDFLVNTGMYMLKPQVLKLIPKGRYFDITDLIYKIKGAKGKIGVFPIDEKSWIDVGQWKEYHDTVKEFNIS